MLSQTRNSQTGRRHPCARPDRIARRLPERRAPRCSSRFQTMKCCGVGRVHDIDGTDVAGIFLADVLEHAFCAGPFHPHRDSRIFGFECLGELFGHRQVGRGVVDDLAFFLCCRDQLWSDRLRPAAQPPIRPSKARARRQCAPPVKMSRREIPLCFIFVHSLRA